MTKLSERAEAGEDAAALLRELWQAAHPGAFRDISGYPANLHVKESEEEVSSRRTFRGFLYINTPEAYLAAAVMLVPKGWMVTQLAELGGAGGCSCNLGNPGTGQFVIADAGEPTMAHALIAAIAKTMEADDGGE